MNMGHMGHIPQNTQSHFADPRRDGDFVPEYYPRANGQEAPPLDATEQNDRIVLEFLAAYYHLNCEYSRLLELRKEANSAERSQAERKSLQAIEKVLIVRDALEDRCAPLGVIAEPVVKDGFTTNLKISFGNVDAEGRNRSDLYTLTAYVPVPLPKGTKFETVPIKIEGPGFNGEY
jgi:hypothetical protein